MKPLPSLLLATAAVAAFALFASAQERRPEGGPPPGRFNPIFAALDTNGDGVIDAQEIANAAASLKKLDRNGDGKITEDEVRPNFEGRGGPGGRGPGGRGAPGANADEMVSRLMAFDKNGDGKISKDELPERMAGMMERGDLDKDGFLSRDEIVQLARAQAAAAASREGDRNRNERR